MKLSLVVALCAAVMALPVYAQSRPDGAMSISEAYRALKDAIPHARDVRGVSPSHFRISETGVETTYANGVVQFRYRDTPDPKLETCGLISNCAGDFRVFAKATHGGNCCSWFWLIDRKDLAERFVAAFKTLAAGMPPESVEEIERFQATVAQYRNTQPKPEFPEEARRFRVRAEAALKEKRWDDAADRYEEALRNAPWWPEGRFNRALVLGELERYTEATREMKKYLALALEAPNARQAQDQIYAWEDKVGSNR